MSSSSAAGGFRLIRIVPMASPWSIIEAVLF
jgi:hypothetical protein